MLSPFCASLLLAAVVQAGGPVPAPPAVIVSSGSAVIVSSGAAGRVSVATAPLATVTPPQSLKPPAWAM